MNVKTTSTIDKPAIHGGQPVRRRPFARTCCGGPEEKALLLECLERPAVVAILLPGRLRRPTTSGRFGVLTFGCGSAAHPATQSALARRPASRAASRRSLPSNVGVEFAVSANSGTSGLVMALGAIDVGPGDEVLVPCMSFHASATAVLAFGRGPRVRRGQARHVLPRPGRRVGQDQRPDAGDPGRPPRGQRRRHGRDPGGLCVTARAASDRGLRPSAGRDLSGSAGSARSATWACSR